MSAAKLRQQQPSTAIAADCPNASTIDSSTLDTLQAEIDFIPNSSFEQASDIHRELVESTLAELNSADAPADLPAHLQRICASSLLTPDQERMLFREMNFLKFSANKLRSTLDLNDPDPESVLAIRSLLSRATDIRDHIIKANTRLVISIVKKFVTPQQSFDDMLSDGIFTLMQAVEKFDFDRGFRFSTYAYRSIARNAYRSVKTAQREEARVTRDAEEWAFGQEDTSSSIMNDQTRGNLSEVTSMLIGRLDRRERFIIRSRYALGAHRKKRTFQFLADKLGVSKERARQLEKRAVEKLQDMAAGLDIDELSGALTS